MILKRFYSILAAIIILLCTLFTACTPDDTTKEKKTCSVVVADSSYFSTQTPISTIEKGGDLVITLLFNNGYTFKGVNYKDYAVDVSQPDSEGKRQVELKLNGVKYDSYLEISATSVKKYYTVSLQSNSAFVAKESTLSVEEGENAVFSLAFDSRFTAKSADYKGEYFFTGVDSPLDSEGKRQITLTLNNVCKNENITVEHVQYVENQKPTPIEGLAVVKYIVNGGQFVNGANSLSYTINYSLGVNPRPNASNGLNAIIKPNNVLIGWNTEADGSGMRVGLGSRVPIIKGQSINLYAQWAEWTEVSAFDYQLINVEYLDAIFKGDMTFYEALSNRKEGDMSAVITGYSGGNRERIVIPEFIEDYPVTGVYTGAITNVPALTTAIMPNSMRYLYSQAFKQCPLLKTLYVHDGMLGLEDDCLGASKQIEKLYINALVAPTYRDVESGMFATKMEMLINHPNDMSKIIVWGTCATMYAIRCPEIENIFRNFDVLNMGVVGETCQLYQIDLMLQYLQIGDAIVQLLDIGLPFAFFADVTFDNRVYMSIEDNYDLLSSLNTSRYDNVLGGFSSHVRAKNTLLNLGVEHTYEQGLDYLSADGDVMSYCEGNYDNKGEGLELITDKELQELDAINKMKAAYDYIVGTGINVYVDYSPMNKDNLDIDRAYEIADMLALQFTKLNFKAKLIGKMDYCIFDSQYVFDANYHLSTEGAELYTQYLIENLYVNW